MYEEKVREQLQEALLLFDAEEKGRSPVPRVSTLRDYGMLTSDEGLVLDYGDGGVFTLQIGCYRHAVQPDEEDV